MFRQNRHRYRLHFCRYCLQYFGSEEILNKHTQNCIVVNRKQAVRMPKIGDSVQLKNCHKQLPAPFVIYADFEALTQKIDSCQPDDNKAYTEKYQKHVDCGYAYKLVCCYDDKFSKPIQPYGGEKGVYKFLEAIIKEAEYCKKVKKDYFNQPMNLIRWKKNLQLLQNVTFARNTLPSMTSESEITVILQENIEARHTMNVI